MQSAGGHDTHALTNTRVHRNAWRLKLLWVLGTIIYRFSVDGRRYPQVDSIQESRQFAIVVCDNVALSFAVCD